MKLINQVDNKFILVNVSRNEANLMFKVSSNLFIFDQHAVDERIKLEALEKEVLEQEVRGSFSTSNQYFSCDISPREGQTAMKHRALLESWGISGFISV
jgi:DNA mismatch repair ATPase MutL